MKSLESIIGGCEGKTIRETAQAIRDAGYYHTDEWIRIRLDQSKRRCKNGQSQSEGVPGCTTPSGGVGKA